MNKKVLQMIFTIVAVMCVLSLHWAASMTPVSASAEEPAPVKWSSPQDPVPVDRENWSILFNRSFQEEEIASIEIRLIGEERETPVAITVDTRPEQQRALVATTEPYLPSSTYRLEVNLANGRRYHMTFHTDRVVEDGVILYNFSPDEGEFFPGDRVTATLQWSHQQEDSQTFWVGYSLMDPAGQWHDVPAQQVRLNPGSKRTTRLHWTVPEDPLPLSGDYTAVMAVWSERPDRDQAERLATAEKASAFQVFRVIDDFSSLDPERWLISRHRLGLGRFRPDHVQVKDGLLHLTIPASSHDGGEVQTRERYLYGSYRIRMKLPQAPDTLTGFFLYQQPDYDHEIDIEIENHSDGKTYLVTYAQGERSNLRELHLSFDPTDGFYEYRFDFYPGVIHFYAEDELLQSWHEGLTDTPMHLMINLWAPRWLGGETYSTDKTLLVDWIKY